VSLEPSHGYSILLRIQQIFGEHLQVRFAPPSTVLNGVDGSKANERIRERTQSKVLSPDEVRQTQLKEETAKWSDMAGIAASILFETETLSRRQ